MGATILPRLSPISEWDVFIDEALKYHKTAMGGLKRPKVFTTEIIYNIIAMSIEKYFMGYLMFNHNLPENHTLKDLIDAVVKVSPLDKGLDEKFIKDIEYMDAFQEICSVDFYKRVEPNEKDIEQMLKICNGVKEFVMTRVSLPINA